MVLFNTKIVARFRGVKVTVNVCLALIYLFRITHLLYFI